MSPTRTQRLPCLGWPRVPRSWEDWEQLSRVVAIESYVVPEPAVGTSGHSEEIWPRPRGSRGTEWSASSEVLVAGPPWPPAVCAALKGPSLCFPASSSLWLLNSPLLCLLSRNFTSYFDVLHCVDLVGLCASPPPDRELLEGRDSATLVPEGGTRPRAQQQRPRGMEPDCYFGLRAAAGSAGGIVAV